MVPDPPGISVIIPTYRRRASLERVLEAVSSQVYPRPLIEVLVICDGDVDGSAAAVRGHRYPVSVQVFEQPNQGPAAARNLGLRHSRGPFVLFLDDDVVPAPCLVAEHARAHQMSADLVVIGPLLAPVGLRAPWVRWETLTLEEQYEAMEARRFEPTPRQFHTGNASVRLEHLRRAGGFNVNFRRGEDVELGFRLYQLGLRFVFHRAAAASHIAERPFQEWLGTAYEYGRTDVALGRMRGEGNLPSWVSKEFRSRHPHTQRLVRWGLRHRGGVKVLFPLAKSLAVLAQGVQRPRLAHNVCSGIFNLAYWCGVSDQLGAAGDVEVLLGSKALTDNQPAGTTLP